MKWKDRIGYFFFKTWEILNTDIKVLTKREILQLEGKKSFKIPTDAVDLPENFTIVEAFKYKKKQLTCSHEFVLGEQVWWKIGKKKFELRDEWVCKKCLFLYE